MLSKSVTTCAALVAVSAGLIAPVDTASASYVSSRGAAIASGCSARGLARVEPSKALPPHRLAGYHLTFCDDFQGPRLGRGWFLFQGQPGGDPGAMFDPSHVQLHGGQLTINTYRDRSNGGSWATGGLCHCGHAQTYGAFFVRSRVTGGGDDNDELLWPSGHSWPPEIDFNETSPYLTRTASYVHYDASNRQIGHQLRINLVRWHTWGVLWSARSIVFTVDGRVWSRVVAPAAIPHVPMTLDLQEQTFCFNRTACPTHPVSLRVDWVSVFEPAR
jgi:hypothetical protein